MIIFNREVYVHFWHDWSIVDDEGVMIGSEIYLVDH